MRLFATLVVLTMVFTGCGGSDESEPTEQDLVVSGPGGATSAIDNAEEESSDDESGTSSPVDEEEGSEGTGTVLQDGNGGAEEPVCTPYDEGVTDVHGTLYVDDGVLSLSVYEGTKDDAEDAGLEGQVVRLLPEDRATVTCEDGHYGFEEVEPGYHVVDFNLDGDVCSTRNCPVRFPEAIREGEVRITTFGDSVPKVGSGTLFPQHLAGTIEELASVVSKNVAVPGSKSVDWTPGTYNFENELRPVLAETDVLIASIGGNDVTAYAAEVMSSGDIGGALGGGVNDKLTEILGNVLETFEEARAVNPDIDLVYCLYPYYANSSQWGSFLGGFPGVGDLVSGLVFDALTQAREEMPMEPGLILVDMFGALGDEDISDILYDELHFNDEGHQLYAAEIFRALGGIEVKDGWGTEPVSAGLLVAD